MTGELLIVRMKFKDGFDRLIEHARDAKSERETRIVLLGLDRVDGLARHLQPGRKLCLRPISFCAKDAEAVHHHIASDKGNEFG